MHVCMVWYGMVWYGMVWYGVVWCGVVWCGVVWCGVVRRIGLESNWSPNWIILYPESCTTTVGHWAVEDVFWDANIFIHSYLQNMSKTATYSDPSWPVSTNDPCFSMRILPNGGFLKSGVLPTHPFIDGIFPYKPSINRVSSISGNCQLLILGCLQHHSSSSVSGEIVWFVCAFGFCNLAATSNHGKHEIWPFQDAIHWRYLPYIFGLGFRSQFQGISQENMAWNMVLMYPYLLGSWRSPIES